MGDALLPKSLAWLDIDRLARTQPMPGWESYARCDVYGPDRFYPELGDTDTPKKAKAICAQCPAVYACLATCLRSQGSNADHGIWGRTSSLDRRKIRRALEARRAREHAA